MAHHTSVSRRSFVKSTAALAVAAPTIISARALGSESTPSPSNRITLGFIGIGKQASGHLDFLSGRSDTQVLAVCDVHSGRRERARTHVEEKYKKLERPSDGIAEYKTYQELLDRKDVDAVVIGVPDHWHTAIALNAARAGKDIYCEKPLTLTIHEAKVIIDGVRKYDRVFQTGSQQRSSGPFHLAVNDIRDGKIGKIKEVWVGIGTTSKPCDLPTEPTPDGIDFDQWLGQAPERGYNDVLCRRATNPNDYPFNPGWRDYREYSGGYITDWGAHHFDITQWALGMDHSGPVEILPPSGDAEDGYGAQFIYRGSPVGDEILVTHKHVVYEGEGIDRKTKEKKKISETNGILFIGTEGKIFVNRSMIVSEPDSIVAGQKEGQQVEHRTNWLNCIRSRQKPVCDVEIGARSVTVCHLVNLAYWHNRKLAWDPQTWEFPGDAEANAWRDRPRRAKYDLPQV
ncbi:MAG TPA: Gfo/Idh/MocA family oxidoreductase [Tepidisphaeraceae bacterium]